MEKAFLEELEKFMSRIRMEMIRRTSGPLAKDSVTIPQLILLEVVYKESLCTVSYIAKNMGITTSAVTGLTDRLIRSKLINRTRGIKDRRLVIISLSEKGKNLIRRLLNERHRMLKKAFSGLSQKERRDYLSLLQKIYSALTKK